MEVSITDITEIEKEIQIQTTAEELVPHLEEAYKRYQPKIEIRGFRKGKAPLDLVKRIHGESIEYNSLDTIASDVYRQVAKDRDVHPIGEPILTDIDYKRGESLTFKVKYEIKPKIELKEYKAISVEKIVHKVTEKELADEILRLQKANSTMQEVESSNDFEHVITADIQQLDETGNPLIGKKNSDVRLYLANESIFPEIKNALKNTTRGATHRVKIDHEHEGKKIIDNLEITVKKVEKVNVPEFSDDIVKKITNEKITTVTAFREQLGKDLENYWQDRTERKLTDTIMSEIVRRHEFTVPETLIKGILDSFVEELKNQHPNKKLPADFNQETFRESNRGYAVFQAKWFLLRERIIESENLKVNDDDLNRLAEIEAPKVGFEKDRLVQFYKSSNSVQERILTDKLMAFLKQNSKISEKITEEFID